jgi:Secretion system C-terminal sorting domain
MKKTTLFLMFSLLALCSSVNAQTDFYTALPNNGGTSGNARAPQAADRYDRSVWLITATEMAAAGFVTGDVVNSIGFNYATASDVVASGTFKVYLLNTANTTNTKSLTWTTAISGMTLASNSTITIPAAIGTVDFPFSGGTAFTYTGGGIYIATDYQNAAGTIATVQNVALCNFNSTLVINGARSTTAVPTALTASSYRPETRLGKVVACAKPLNVTVPSSTLTSANITFSSSNPVNLEYGAYDFTPGTAAGTTVSGVTSPYVLSGLPNSTAYEVYAKSDCGGFTGLSANAYGGSFHTTFIPANPNYNTSFEVDDYPNIGWVADPETNGSDWFINFGGTGSTLVQNGLYSAVSLANATATSAAIMYSRGVNLVAGSSVTVTYYDKIYLSTASTTSAAPSITTSDYTLAYGTEQTPWTQTNILATVTGAANTSFALKSYQFTPATTGVYYFSILNTTAANAAAAATPSGQEALIIDNFTVSQVLANNEVLESKFATYPNPTKNVINVTNTTDALISAIEITDLNGRVVKNVKVSDVAEAQISVSDLAQGVYTLKIVSDKGIATKKIIKE